MWPLCRKSMGPPLVQFIVPPSQSAEEEATSCFSVPRGPLGSPEASPLSSCLSDLSPGGRKQDVSALVFVKITESPRVPALKSVRDGPCIHNRSWLCVPLWWRLITSFIIANEAGEVRSVAAADKDQRRCLFEKAKVVRFICISRFYTNCFGLGQEMILHNLTGKDSSNAV